MSLCSGGWHSVCYIYPTDKLLDFPHTYIPQPSRPYAFVATGTRASSVLGALRSVPTGSVLSPARVTSSPLPVNRSRPFCSTSTSMSSCSLPFPTASSSSPCPRL